MIHGKKPEKGWSIANTLIKDDPQKKKNPRKGGSTEEYLKIDSLQEKKS